MMVVPAFSAAVDRFFERAIVQSCFVPRRVDGHIERLAQAAAILSSLSDAELFPEPSRAVMQVLDEGRYRGMPTQTLAWDLPYVPASDAFGLTVQTTRPRATLFARGGRPIWVLVHGWLGGSRLMDEVFWPLRSLYRTHDFVLVTLPGHGARRHPNLAALPSFPSRNPVRNVLGLLTAVTETRQVVAWLRELGYDEIGVAGSSLGVQVAALLATIGPLAERFLFDRPLVDLSDPLRRAHETPSDGFRRLVEALRTYYARVSPLERPSRVSPELRRCPFGTRGPCGWTLGGARFGATFRRRASHISDRTCPFCRARSRHCGTDEETAFHIRMTRRARHPRLTRSIQNCISSPAYPQWSCSKYELRQSLNR
ncbi:MAG: alpha/beta hydrolase [Polyangiaceae bacterium]